MSHVLSGRDLPVVSVVMPCRNCAATLPEAMQSLLGQTLESLEIIAVDDGSTDATPDLLESYALNDHRVLVLSRPFEGIVSALNHGLHAARADLVARMDADDVAFPNRLAAQTTRLIQSPDIDLLGCRVALDQDHARNRGFASYAAWSNSLLTMGEISRHRFVENPVVHPTMVFRKECVDRAGGYREGAFPEDYELVLRWLEHGATMAKLDAELLMWRDSPGRLSRTDPRCSVESFYRMKSGYLARWLRRHNPHHPGVVILGAGRRSAPRAMLLENHGVRIEAFHDLDPARTGRHRYGRPVRSLAELPDAGGVFCLSYVGVRGAREEVAVFLAGKGYELGRDALLAA